MASHNRFELIGRLGRDAEFRNNPMNHEQLIVTFNVATDFPTRDTDTDGKTIYGTDWNRVTAFVPHGHFTTRLTKGDLVRVEGRIKPSRWENTDGTHYGIDLVATKTQVLLRSSPKDA